MRMEPAESSETSDINVTWTPGTYPKDKLQLEHGESLKSRIPVPFSINSKGVKKLGEITNRPAVVTAEVTGYTG